MTLTQRISDLEEKYLKDEERAVDLLNRGKITKELFAYTLASLSIDVETEKVKVYLAEGLHKDGAVLYKCASNAFRQLALMTRDYQKPQENMERDDFLPAIDDDYKSLINILINRFNETLGDVFPIKLENIR